MNQELMDRGLSKWPQMYTTGTPVTVEQAKEIIRRTDTFFRYGWSGNERKFNTRVKKMLGIPNDDEIDYQDPKRVEKLNVIWREQEAWQSAWGVIHTEYVFNSWIASSYVGGPHGWCHPDGTIGFIDNVGKWPSVEQIFDEWQTLAKEFPFIDIGVTLMNGEYCENRIEKVVSMVIKNGEVKLVDPTKEDVHAGHPAPTRSAMNPNNETDEAFWVKKIGSRSSENMEFALTMDWINEWAQLAKQLGLV